ncbi:competence protein ComGA [Amphibacillus marinus]|uniref:Competence protein ComGA n=1 Tax=Amphibacillus marinus TaxID=872970 RepID=A0A1H8HDH7_9BACI|nr:competence type IV pilus ATPase ComGA [Amphibacillus marinus]SEN54332.1 competence protein ComGA [Amphibacillus marinus]
MINVYPSTTFLTALFSSALKRNATDIHFSPRKQGIDVFFRVNGNRVPHQEISHNQYRQTINHLKFTSGMDISETRLPQDGVITVTAENTLLDIRISTLPTVNNESLALRILPQTDNRPLTHLLLFPYQQTLLNLIFSRKSGLVLFTGPTGSGKTTLLYSLLNHLLDQQPCQAITLEDPIEKNIHALLQVQINEKNGMTYHTGLKAALRHDPDILMVGEIRDHKTAAFVFHAAYTGHLVFSTLHARDAIGTIHRLLDMGIKPIDLEQNLLAVVALELIPIIQNGHCSRRAAIIEILQQQDLNQAIFPNKDNSYSYQTFAQLKRKAIAYGFASTQLND